MKNYKTKMKINPYFAILLLLTLSPIFAYKVTEYNDFYKEILDRYYIKSNEISELQIVNTVLGSEENKEHLCSYEFLSSLYSNEIQLKIFDAPAKDLVVKFEKNTNTFDIQQPLIDELFKRMMSEYNE